MKLKSSFKSVVKPISSIRRRFPASILDSPSRWWLQQVLVHNPGEWYFLCARCWSMISLLSLTTKTENALWSKAFSWASIFSMSPICSSFSFTNITFSSNVFLSVSKIRNDLLAKNRLESFYAVIYAERFTRTMLKTYFCSHLNYLWSLKIK